MTLCYVQQPPRVEHSALVNGRGPSLRAIGVPSFNEGGNHVA